MINYIEIFSYYILICQLVFLFPVIKIITLSQKIIILIIIAYLVTIPKIYLNVNIIYILRGSLGDLSFVSIILILIIFIVNLLDIKCNQFKFRLINSYSMLLVFLFGTILYLSTLGFINFDIYHFGFNYSGMLMILFAIGLFYLLYFCDLYFLVMVIAFVGYFFRIQLSMNLFDYLIDPMLWIYSIIYLFKRFILNVK